MKDVPTHKTIVADSSTSVSKGTHLVVTPNGSFLIKIGQVDEKSRVIDTVTAIPNHHPGKKKVIIKKYNAGVGLIQCKTAVRRQDA